MIIKIYKSRRGCWTCNCCEGKDEAYLQLATIYVAEGKNKIAIDYITKLIKDREIDKENNEAAYLLASANFRIENIKKQCKILNKR